MSLLSTPPCLYSSPEWTNQRLALYVRAVKQCLYTDIDLPNISRNIPIFYVCSVQVQLAEALLWPSSGPVAGLSAQRRLQLYPGGLCHPGGALPVLGAAHRHQTPTM